MDLTKTFLETRRTYTGRVGLVPTMGFFHEGHLSLMKLLRPQCDTLVVSLFVNPTQFDNTSDLDSYPRDLDRDMEMAESEGVDVMFAPETDHMYPSGSTTQVEVPGISSWMEGKHRPGHFGGVATVVTKLFAGLQPDIAVFARKDAQQLAVIKTLTRDLRFPVELVEAPTIRDHDGLALSSRNVHLDRMGREKALSISRGLFQAAEQIDAGETRGGRLEATVRRSMRAIEVEYVTLASADTMVPIQEMTQRAVLAVAGAVDGVRLIDNIVVDIVEGRPIPDRGVILDEPSRVGTLR